MRHFTIKNRIKETRLFKHRLIAAMIVVILLASCLISRLVYLQICQHRYYTTLSTKNDIELVPIDPRRGLIYDRHGMLLAKNNPVFSLVVVPNKTKNLKQELKALSKIITLRSSDYLQFAQQLKQRRRFERIPLKIKLTDEEVAKFAVNRFHFPGFFVKARLMRSYPLGYAFAHVLGYVGRINETDLSQVDPINYAATNFIGKVGLEKYYETALHGKVGYKKIETDASGETVRTLNETKPIKGHDLYLTIDTDLQIATETALGNNKGAVVAIEPKTGAILAMVSEPAYDPNVFVQGINQKDYNTLLHNKNFPLYNRTLRGLYAPGSTIKPFIALLALDSGVTTVSRQIYDPGWYQVPNTHHIFHDWKRSGHGWINLTNAIVQSCDTYFYDLAHKLGIKRLDHILRVFGFGSPTQIDMGEELAGNVPTPAWKMRNRGTAWYSGDTVQEGIGQGFLQVTPLQLAVSTAAIANRGKWIEPHLLYAMKMPNGTYQFPILTTREITLKQPKNWDIIINAMKRVITSGTGYRFGHPRYSVAAKTGTAQVIGMRQDSDNQNKFIPVRLRDNSLFIAFAPIKNPQIAIAVVAENTDAASIIARKVLDYYLLKDKNHKPLVLKKAKEAPQLALKKMVKRS